MKDGILTMQQLITTISLLVAAGSAILSIIFFAIYLIKRESPAKKAGKRKAAAPPDEREEGESGLSPVTIDLLAPPTVPEEAIIPPQKDHFKVVEEIDATPKEEEKESAPASDEAAHLTYDDVMERYFGE